MPHAGGWGGFEGGDGEDGLINNVNGGFKDYPVEVFEVKYPALIRGYGFRPDTGGPGRFRGGCGLYRRFEVETRALPLPLVRALGDARAGASSAAATRSAPTSSVNPGRDDERHMLKVNAHPLAPGSVVDMRDGRRRRLRRPARARPGARPRRRPRRLRQPSRPRERDYGVVLDDALAVDVAATERLRASRPVQ